MSAQPTNTLWGNDNAPRMDRREAIKWIATAAASVALLERGAFGQTAAETGGAPSLPPITAPGYGTDPNLIKTYAPGEVWPLTLTEAERATAAALCDVIIPADEKGPSASAVHVPDFIDEWISAPYPAHHHDRVLIVEGLAWIDGESERRFGRQFGKSTTAQQYAVCDDICHVPKAKPEFARAAQFFKRFRDLTAGGYYTTPEGMKDIGYTGNVALGRFDGPPPEVLARLGLG